MKNNLSMSIEATDAIYSKRDLQNLEVPGDLRQTFGGTEMKHGPLSTVTILPP